MSSLTETIIPLYIPLKIAVDAEVSTDAKTFDQILNYLSKKPGNQNSQVKESEIQRLVDLRRAAYNALGTVSPNSINFNGQIHQLTHSERVSALLTYCKALLDLETMGVCDDFGEDFEFHWTCALIHLDAFNENYDDQDQVENEMPVFYGNRLAYERACILFNVVALNIQNSIFNRDGEDELNGDTRNSFKDDYEMHQTQASILKYLQSNFSSTYKNTSSDLSKSGLQMLEKAILAEGQVAYLQNALALTEASGRMRQDSVNAKLAASAALLYKEALDLADSLEVSFSALFMSR